MGGTVPRKGAWNRGFGDSRVGGDSGVGKDASYLGNRMGGHTFAEGGIKLTIFELFHSSPSSLVLLYLSKKISLKHRISMS